MPEHADRGMRTPHTSSTSMGSARYRALARAAAFFGLWLMLMPDLKAADLVFGLCAALAATWASLRLAPPDTNRLRPGRLFLLLPHLLWQTVRGGIDVAGRALAPRLPLHPGLVRYPTGYPPGQARNTFASITSLLPGTVTCEETAGELIYHGLDVTQPVAEQLADEERRLSTALRAGRGHE